jgi:hypothetical protein
VIVQLLIRVTQVHGQVWPDHYIVLKGIKFSGEISGDACAGCKQEEEICNSIRKKSFGFFQKSQKSYQGRDKTYSAINVNTAGRFLQLLHKEALVQNEYPVE